MPQFPRLRWFLAVLAIAAIYFLAGKIGLSFASLNPSASVVWPPTGIALAAFLLLGRGVWPGVFVGALLVNATTAGNLASSIGIATGNTIEGVLAAWLVERFANGRRAFETPTDVFRYAGLAGILATLISPTIGVTSLALAGSAPWAAFSRIWITWWLGDVSGVLVLAPFLVLSGTTNWLSWNPRRFAEGALVVILTFVMGQFVFERWPFSYARLGFVCAPPLVWAAFRFEQLGAAGATLVLSAIAIWGTLRGFGPFAGNDREISLIFLQSFMAVLSVSMLAIAASVSQRKRAETMMQRLNSELEERIAERTVQLERAIDELRNEISEHERADEDLKRSQAHLLEAQQIGHVGSWEWNIGEDQIWWSDEMYRIYGFVPTDSISYAKYLEAIHPDDRARVDETIRQAFQNGGPFTFEHRITRVDGEIRNLNCQGRLVCDERGQPLRMFGIGQDITERRRAEEERSILRQEQMARLEAEEANRRKDEFLAILSHELRTPISSITLWSHLLREGALDEPTTRRAIDVIDRNARVQSRLIQDILDIARLDTGKLQIRAEEVRLPEVIAAAMDSVQPHAEERTVRMESVIEHGLPTVTGDPDRLQQIVSNLLSNAIKFTPAEGKVEARLRQVGSKVEIAVADDGPGIDPQFLPHIFDPFRQDDSSTTRRHGGLGLGLAIVQRLVALHGGSVSAENRTDRSGSIFRVRLAAIVSSDGNGSAPEATPVVNQVVRAVRKLEGIRVLLVDDENDAGEVLSTALASYGANVVVCTSAADGMRALARRPFDVLISDIAMPEEDGFTFMKRVRLMGSPEVALIPAIALTAYATDDYVNRTLEAGFQIHVAKPVEAEQIAHIVSRLASGVLSPGNGSTSSGTGTSAGRAAPAASA